MSCQEWTGVRRIDLGGGAADRWTTDCQACGWFGPDRTTRPQAAADAEAHCGGGYRPPGVRGHVKVPGDGRVKVPTSAGG